MLIAYTLFMIHAGAAWIHFLLAYWLWPIRRSSLAINLFTGITLLSGSAHLGLIIIRGQPLYEDPGIYSLAVMFTRTSIYFLAVFSAFLFVGELRKPPSQPNFLSTFLLQIIKKKRLTFLAGLIFLGLLTPLNFAPLWFDLPGWLLSLLKWLPLLLGGTMGMTWNIAWLSGLRPPSNAYVFSRLPFRLAMLFAIGAILPLLLFPQMEQKLLLETLSAVCSVPFAMLLAWYRFRLAFLDTFLKHLQRLVLTILFAAGVVRTFADHPKAGIHFIWIPLTLLVWFWIDTQIRKRINGIWMPKAPFSKVPFQLALSKCHDRDACLKAAERFMGKAFDADVQIEVGHRDSSIQIPGHPPISMEVGPVRNIYPWQNSGLAQLRTWGLLIQGHLRRIEESDLRRMAALRAEAAAKEAAVAELKALQTQINPHFLFNTLNAIHTFVRSDPDEAEETIEDLAELMRTILQSTQAPYWPLHKELDLVGSYLRIEQRRFGSQLKFQVRVDPGHLREHPIPPLCIQPLAENAVKHGMAPKQGQGLITINVDCDARHLFIRVKDDGQGFSSLSGLGIAIQNIRGRLNNLYGTKASFDIDAQAGQGTCASLKIPLQTPQT